MCIPGVSIIFEEIFSRVVQNCEWRKYASLRGSEDPRDRKSSMSASLLVPSACHRPTLTASLEMVVALGEKYWHQGWSTTTSHSQFSTHFPGNLHNISFSCCSPGILSYISFPHTSPGIFSNICFQHSSPGTLSNISFPRSSTGTSLTSVFHSVHQVLLLTLVLHTLPQALFTTSVFHVFARLLFQHQFFRSSSGTFSKINFHAVCQAYFPTQLDSIYKRVKEQCSSLKYLHLFMKKCLPKMIFCWQCSCSPVDSLVPTARKTSGVS